jgi:hypothetical protein
MGCDVTVRGIIVQDIRLENATPQTIRLGETMEKTKTSPCSDNKSNQVILFVMENITSHGSLAEVRKPGKRERNGA